MARFLLYSGFMIHLPMGRVVKMTNRFCGGMPMTKPRVPSGNGLRVVLLISLLVVAPSLLMAQTYYVDFGGGNDSNDGLSRAFAWRTIPGTRTADNKGYISSHWGSINEANKVPAGAIILLRRGNTHGASNGGTVWMDDVYYAGGTASNRITLAADATWGTGDVVFDGAGITINIALILIQIDGIVLDGSAQSLILIRNSPETGVQVKEKDGSGASVDNIQVRNVRFYRNGTSFTATREGVGDAQLFVRKTVGLLVSGCEFDGAGLHTNGLLVGEAHMYGRDVLIENCTSHDHVGEDPPNDAGIGFKSENSIVTFSQCKSYNNLKGFDLGEEKSDNVDITYKLLACEAFANKWGVNLNGPGNLAYTGTIKFYVVNCVVRDNRKTGSNIYGGPYELFFVHNLYCNNGNNPDAAENSADFSNIRIHPDNAADATHIVAHLYNSIFYKPAKGMNYVTHYWKKDVNDYSLDSDYNCWTPKTTAQNFVMWDYSSSTKQVLFPYSQGPGSTASQWYLWYDHSTTPPANGCTGHYHCDANSQVVDPQLYDIPGGDYHLARALPGIDLRTKAWYIAEMGVDKEGISRSEWNMGPLEIIPAFPLTAPKGLRIKNP